MMNTNYLLMRISIIGVLLFSIQLSSFSQRDVMMQAFYWDVPVNEAAKDGFWWDSLAAKADDMKESGITGLWLPSPAKGNWGITDNGYGIYDHYDLGNYLQKGSTETRFGSRSELESMIAAMHNTEDGKPKIDVYADIVLNHVMADWQDNLESNPEVKAYVFDGAYRGGVQYTPYPNTEIIWVIPNAAPGDYYIKIKGANIKESYNDQGIRTHEQGYDVHFSWTDDMSSADDYWESEPNGGSGQFDLVANSGDTIHGRLGTAGNHSEVDEYKVTIGTAHDLKITIRAMQEPLWGDWSWGWGDQTNSYFPGEIWHNGQNLAESSLEARTFTNIHYVNHTGAGEPNYTWTYTDFHPVDASDFITNWDWNGGQDAIIPNTKGFGSDFNTYSSRVQNRLKDWGVWLSDQIGFDGYRLDFVRGIQSDFVAEWVDNLPLLDGNQRFIVGEYWTDHPYRLNDWVTAIDDYNGADVDAFDFPLRKDLNRMCRGDEYFNMSWLNHSGMVRNNGGESLPGTSVVTWIDNHDTGKEWDKWVTKDWTMGYSYILFHEGRPCLFYPHYYGGTLHSNHNGHEEWLTIPSLKGPIDDLMFIRETYLGGGLEVLTETGNPYPSNDVENVYVARRHGNGAKDGAILVINNANTEKGIWVDVNATGFSSWTGKTLKNAFDGSSLPVYSSGRAYFSAPARGYSIYVLADDYVAIGTKSATYIAKHSAKDSGILIYPTTIPQDGYLSINVAKSADVSLNLYNTVGALVGTLHSGYLSEGNHDFKLSNLSLSKGNYIVQLSQNDHIQTKRLVIY